MSLYCAVIFLVLGSMSTPAPAQDLEPLSAEEILRWFPIGDYEVIDHEETAALFAAESFEAFSELSGYNRYRSAEYPFPQDLMGEAEWITHARRVRIFVYIQSDEDDNRRRDEHGPQKGAMDYGRRKERTARMAAMDIGDKAYAAEGVGEDLFVLRFLDPGAVLKKYLEAGYFAETEHAIGSRRVFTTSRDPGRGFERELFVTFMPTGEMLAADSLDMLKGMAAANSGEINSILGDQKYVPCRELLDEKGYVYRWVTFNNMFEAMIKYAAKRDAPQEQINAQRAKMAQMEVANSELWLLSYSEVIHKSFAHYTDEETAAAAEEHQGSRGALMGRLTAGREPETKSSVVGDTVIVTTTYDEEMIKQMNRERGKKAAEKQ